MHLNLRQSGYKHQQDLGASVSVAFVDLNLETTFLTSVSHAKFLTARMRKVGGRSDV